VAYSNEGQLRYIVRIVLMCGTLTDYV